MCKFGKQRLLQLRALDALGREREPQRQDLAPLDATRLRSFAGRQRRRDRSSRS
jgi:hypothetical protein